MTAARKRTKQKNTRLREWWASLFDWPAIRSRIFSPEPEALPPFPTQAEFLRGRSSNDKTVLREYERRLEERNRQVAQRRAFHDETSKTIRRVFYMLVGTCLFCIITLAGAPDAQLLTPEATVNLPVLNYPISLAAFLIVGPVVLIALTIYLHIFVAQQRGLEIAPKDKQPTLPNFSGWTPSMAALFIFYWMVPITLAVFAWKAWPRPNGPILVYITFGVAAVLVLLQMRRCPRAWRAWALPSLVVAYAFFYVGVNAATTDRHLNLFKADLSGKDLRNTNLSGAFLSEANLCGANLREANLSVANLTAANLTAANLTAANLFRADLTGADLGVANLTLANLDGANLSQADLGFANLNEADLRVTNLNSAKLIGANLVGADLGVADLTGADLGAAEVNQLQLNQACGEASVTLSLPLVWKPRVCPGMSPLTPKGASLDSRPPSCERTR